MYAMELVAYKNDYNDNEEIKIVGRGSSYEAALKQCYQLAFEKYGITSESIYKTKKVKIK